MRTPKFNLADVEEIKQMLEGDVSVADTARLLKCSYQTLLKIKKGTYVPNTRPNARSGLTGSVQTEEVSVA